MFTNELIYHHLDKVKKLIDCFNGFDVYPLINKLSLEKQHELSEDYQYWHSIYKNEGKVVYKTNIVEDTDEIEDEIDSMFNGEWHYIKFYSSEKKLNDLISKEIKNTFQEHINLIKDLNLIEAGIHIISKGIVIPPHKDMEHIPDDIPTGRKNLVINVKVPNNFDTRITGFKVIEEIRSPNNSCFMLFDANDQHGAWNFSDEPWIMCVLHIDYADLKL